MYPAPTRKPSATMFERMQRVLERGRFVLPARNELHDALVVRHIEMNLAMGIGPLDLRDRHLVKGGHVGLVVARGSVVRHHRASG